MTQRNESHRRFDSAHQQSHSSIPKHPVAPYKSDGLPPADIDAGGDNCVKTVVWVGEESHREFAEPYAFCKEHARQIAVRTSLTHLLEHPPTAVDRIIVCKKERTPQPNYWEDILQRYPEAQVCVIYGTECEGESRTGAPWTQCRSFAWHAWNQFIPFWFRTEPVSATAAPQKQSVVGITRSTDLADVLQNVLTLAGHSVYWSPSPMSARVRNADVIIWDDTAAPGATREQWRERLAWFQSEFPVGSTAPRHIWCAGFPRYDEWLEARQGGCDYLVSKPAGEPVFRYLLNLIASNPSAQNRTHVKPFSSLTPHPVG